MVSFILSSALSTNQQKIFQTNYLKISDYILAFFWKLSPSCFDISSFFCTLTDSKQPNNWSDQQ